MSSLKRAVFFGAAPGIDHVAGPVFKAIGEEYRLTQTEIIIDSKPVLKRRDEAGDEFYFVRTDAVVCHDYDRYLPILLRYFADFDMAGLITWHEGHNAPDQVFSVHTTGDVDSGNFGSASPQYMHNLLWSLERNRLAEGLENFKITTEGTHWSGIVYSRCPPVLIPQYPVPLVDIEIGSTAASWSNQAAARVIARSLQDIFKSDGLKLNNLLCVGGVHFETGFASAVLQSWDDQAYGISHIIPNQGLVTGHYEDDGGVDKLEACIQSIQGGIAGIAFHDNLKGVYKEKLRILGSQYNVPVFKHQLLRRPGDIPWKK